MFKGHKILVSLYVLHSFIPLSKWLPGYYMARLCDSDSNQNGNSFCNSEKALYNMCGFKVETLPMGNGCV